MKQLNQLLFTGSIIFFNNYTMHEEEPIIQNDYKIPIKESLKSFFLKKNIIQYKTMSNDTLGRIKKKIDQQNKEEENPVNKYTEERLFDELMHSCHHPNIFPNPLKVLALKCDHLIQKETSYNSEEQNTLRIQAFHLLAHSIDKLLDHIIHKEHFFRDQGNFDKNIRQILLPKKRLIIKEILHEVELLDSLKISLTEEEKNDFLRSMDNIVNEKYNDWDVMAHNNLESFKKQYLSNNTEPKNTESYYNSFLELSLNALLFLL